MNILPQVGSNSLAEKFSLNKYRKIVSYPTWNYVSQNIFTTRSYEDGLEGSLLLLRLTEYYKPKLEKKEYESNLRTLYSFVLSMLDSLDRWEEYLELWDKLFQEVPLADTYGIGARNFHGQKIEPFVVAEDEHTLYIHFLWGTQDRKEVIERKLLKKRSGKRIDHLLHAQQDKLTDSEIQGRLERLAWWIETVQKMKLR
jgi:hypothetical protein